MKGEKGGNEDSCDCGWVMVFMCVAESEGFLPNPLCSFRWQSCIREGTFVDVLIMFLERACTTQWLSKSWLLSLDQYLRLKLYTPTFTTILPSVRVYACCIIFSSLAR